MEDRQITLRMTIVTTDEKYKQCVCAGWEKAYGDPLDPAELRETEPGMEVEETDVKNMLLGSCLAELVTDETEMIISLGALL